MNRTLHEVQANLEDAMSPNKRSALLTALSNLELYQALLSSCCTFVPTDRTLVEKSNEAWGTSDSLKKSNISNITCWGTNDSFYHNQLITCPNIYCDPWHLVFCLFSNIERFYHKDNWWIQYIQQKNQGPSFNEGIFSCTPLMLHL